MKGTYHSPGQAASPTRATSTVLRGDSVGRELCGPQHSPRRVQATAPCETRTGALAERYRAPARAACGHEGVLSKFNTSKAPSRASSRQNGSGSHVHQTSHTCIDLCTVLQQMLCVPSHIVLTSRQLVGWFLVVQRSRHRQHCWRTDNSALGTPAGCVNSWICCALTPTPQHHPPQLQAHANSPSDGACSGHPGRNWRSCRGGLPTCLDWTKYTITHRPSSVLTNSRQQAGACSADGAEPHQPGGGAVGASERPSPAQAPCPEPEQSDRLVMLPRAVHTGPRPMPTQQSCAWQEWAGPQASCAAVCALAAPPTACPCTNPCPHAGGCRTSS